MYYNLLVASLGSMVFLFIITIGMLALGFANTFLIKNIQVEIDNLFYMIILFWIKIEKLITFFEMEIINNLFKNFLNTNFNFLENSFINNNKIFFKKKNIINIYDDLQNYKKLITF